MALAVTSDAFNEDDVANRVLPSLCPCLVDKEKLVRDQANKTMDLYLQRIRKFASSMPDTVLPPPSTVDASAQPAPRMSTPQSSEGSSWTGWAISSFTNKVSAAAGEIQSNGGPPSRPSSIPLAAEARRALGTASASALHRQAITSPPATSTRTSTSSNANDYFHDSKDGADEDIEIDDAWGDMEEESFFDASSEVPKKAKAALPAANPFDDNGEPDFAGWLAAQATKKPAAKPLPKGLAKPAAKEDGRPGAAGRVASTGTVGGAGAKKAAMIAPKSQTKPVVAKKIDTKPKETGDDDGWGDGW